ncbi:hypothetical protein, partial [uncultured Dysosmobacter sp.]|uniref:hypothetical protein n=1 Tax=uncultured Dysosmobacter sp. TaxID=2591384 RepID=UPI002604924F
SHKSVPSGAFFSLRCLIYKVHAASGGTLLLYRTSSRLSRTFFKSFLTFIGPHCIRNVFKISYLSLPVNHFFDFFKIDLCRSTRRSDSFDRIPNHV